MSYKTTLVRLSVCPSVKKLSQDWIIIFFWYCTWCYLTIISTDEARYLNKIFGCPNFSRRGQNRPQNYNHGHNILRIFWCFTTFSFHHKWNKTLLLVINWYMRVASRVVERLKNWDLLPTAFSPLVGLSCPHKKKKNRILVNQESSMPKLYGIKPSAQSSCPPKNFCQ